MCKWQSLSVARARFLGPAGFTVKFLCRFGIDTIDPRTPAQPVLARAINAPAAG